MNKGSKYDFKTFLTPFVSLDVTRTHTHTYIQNTKHYLVITCTCILYVCCYRWDTLFVWLYVFIVLYRNGVHVERTFTERSQVPILIAYACSCCLLSVGISPQPSSSCSVPTSVHCTQCSVKRKLIWFVAIDQTFGTTECLVWPIFYKSIQPTVYACSCCLLSVGISPQPSSSCSVPTSVHCTQCSVKRN